MIQQSVLVVTKLGISNIFGTRGRVRKRYVVVKLYCGSA